VETTPTHWQALIFSLKCNLLRLGRWLSDPYGRPQALPVSEPVKGLLISESRSPLYPSKVTAEFALQAGKVQNLRVAARFLHGRTLRAGQVFSFWANVPRPTTARGFTLGRELRAGCVIPAVGGGLCQLSNALYDAALKAGCEIMERHAHTRQLSGSMVSPGRDATIFWNYVDLRFRAESDCQLEVSLTPTELSVRIRALSAATRPPQVSELRPPRPFVHVSEAPPAESCETCGVESCFRRPSVASLPENGCTAWLVDAWSPEHDDYLTRNRHSQDTLLVPMDSNRWKVGPYRWNNEGFARIHTATHIAIRRSIVSRRLRTEGAKRQAAQLRMDAALAEIYARRIPATALHLVVSQNLLPFLWKTGALAGRTFDVLMNRLPFAALQNQLDRAGARWPGTPTLVDFRVGPALVAAESAALAEARYWITPHTAIAELGGSQALRLQWQKPDNPHRRSMGDRVIFPASTLSRKGARELREALDGWNTTVALAGPLLEGPDFWKGRNTCTTGKDWLAGAAMVVLPAWVEHQPRRLLAAVAAGIPVICTSACGLPPQAGVIIVREGDTQALRDAIRSVTSRLDGAPSAAHHSAKVTLR
jgi:hypothetical protein